ncbi:MAG: oligosaccharide flippase family protein, partial [Chryseobacterium sp.]|nr:oligosaccharide flippase family protein [Chryseobacterium sp.]
VSIIFQRVTFPFFSSHQNDNEKIFFLSQSFTRMVGLVFFPFFTFLAVFSEPLVYYGLSESWIMAAPIVQLLAVAYMFQPIIANNMLLLQVKNNTKLYLKVEILTKISGIIILLSTINLGIIYVCYGLIIQLIIQLGITSYFCHMLLQKSMLQQLMIILPHIAMGIFTWILINFLLYNFSRGHFLLYGSILFVLVYICAYMLFFRNHIFGMYKLLSSK